MPLRVMSLNVQVFGCPHAETIPTLGQRRPKSAKARNREVWGTDSAAGAMGIWRRVSVGEVEPTLAIGSL
jgi:hypothetical protein